MAVSYKWFLVAVSIEFLIVHTHVNKYRSDHALDRMLRTSLRLSLTSKLLLYLNRKTIGFEFRDVRTNRHMNNKMIKQWIILISCFAMHPSWWHVSEWYLLLNRLTATNNKANTAKYYVTDAKNIQWSSFIWPSEKSRMSLKQCRLHEWNNARKSVTTVQQRHVYAGATDHRLIAFRTSDRQRAWAATIRRSGEQA